jgi:hypothetical protein
MRIVVFQLAKMETWRSMITFAIVFWAVAASLPTFDGEVA